MTKTLQCDAIIIFYCIYYGIIFIGKLAGLQATHAGAGVFLLLLYGTYWRYLGTIRVDLLVLLILFAMLSPLVPLASFSRETFAVVYPQMTKYYALLFVMLIGISLPLAPVCESRNCRVLYAVILSFLVAGWLSPGGIHHGRWGGQARVQGFLANANNFALTAMSLYCLVDPEKTRGFLRWINHGIVLLMVYFSRTAGAIVSYVAAAGYRFLHDGNGRIAPYRAILLISACFVSAGIVCLVPPGTIDPFGSTIKKIEAVRDNASKVLAGRKVDYYGIILKEKQDVTSGIWRLDHWGEIIRKVKHSSPDRQLFGFGIGTSMTDFGIEPHNDYLRIFYETGIIGLLLNLGIWVVLYRRMSGKYRFIAVAVALFCLTENNYDHFPAMSLLAFTMIGARNPLHGKTGRACPA